MRKSWILFLTILLAACNLPHHLPGIATVTVTETSPANGGSTQCAWTWATHSLPEVSAEVQSALETAGLTGITASAEAFGENCIKEAGKVDSFATMETDFRIRVQTPDLNDKAALGNTLEQILIVLDAFPPGVVPGPRAGYVGVTFQAGKDETHLWFLLADGKSARALDLHGAELLDKLQTK